MTPVRTSGLGRIGQVCLCAWTAWVGCSGDEPAAPARDRLRLEVAPLALPDIGEVVWAIDVASQQGPVWSEASLSADRYGDGRGGLLYIGPCDASANPHTVTLRLVSVRDASGALLGSPADYRDPGPIVRAGVMCAPNADTLVAFDVTIMRRADQGFFDVAVAFDDVFCSAKVDCSDAFLHRPDGPLAGTRGPAAIVGFACASGLDEETWFYLSDLVLTCDDGDVETPAREVRLSSRDVTRDGQQGRAGPLVFDWARYRGHETLKSDGHDVDKCYWNHAIGLDTDAMGADTCTLRAIGTASGEPLSGLPDDRIIPLLTWDVPVWQAGAVCDNHALDATGSAVRTVYSHVLDGSMRALAASFAEYRCIEECVDDAQCQDGVACTVDRCEAGQCVHLTSDAACDDGDACTTDACAPTQALAADGCVHAPSGAPGCGPIDPCAALDCDDDDPCTVLDRCEDGACVPGIAVSCDDGNPCTADACVAGACVRTPVAGPCSDGSACTTDDACVDGACRGTPVQCDDGDLCNGLETCAPATGCVTGTPLVCDDADVCNGVETCAPATGCARGPALDCDDGLACTDDACDPIAGCQSAPGDGPCTDEDPCTDGDACVGTTCVPGPPRDCDDQNACTLDGCGPAGCTHVDDTRAPVITWLGVTAGAAYADSVTPDVAVSGPALGPVVVTLDGAAFVPGTPVTTPGFHVLDATVLGCDGLYHRSTLPFRVDGVDPTIRALVSPPANASGWHHTPVTVTFEGDDEAPDGVSVTEPVIVTTAGENQVVHGSVTDASGRSASLDVSLDIDLVPPDVTLEAPAPSDDAVLTVTGPTLLVMGVFGEDDLSGFALGRITSNRAPIALEVEEPGPFAFEVPILPGMNELVVSASDVAGNTRAILLRVSYDTVAPRAFIQSPVDGVVTTDEVVSVTGVALETTIGPTTPEDVSAAVNGAPAEVADGRFIRTSVPLALGANTITAVVTDRAGRQGTHTITITREAAGGRRLRVVSGDGQAGAVAELLGAPVVVEIVEGAGTGTPVVDVPVLFEITDNDGALEGAAPVAASADGRRVQLLTGPDGRAAIDWTLGSRAGAGVNRVTITAIGVPGSTSVLASGTPGEATRLWAHEGLAQSGLVGTPWLWPLSVAASDAFGNPVAGVDVTFRVTEGAGVFASGQVAVVTTNAKGLAEIIFTPGVPAGPGTQVVVAGLAVPAVPGAMAEAVTFRGSAYDPPTPLLVPTPPDGALALVQPPTTLSGVVYDEDQRPIPDVRVTTTPASTPTAAITGPDGRFTLTGAPSGFVLIEVDGADAVPALATHHLARMTFMANVVPGIDNQLDRPLYLLNLPSGTFVDGKAEVTLTNERLPGLALTIRQGTRVTFPDNSEAGLVSITPVSFDQAPMAPIDGLQPRLLVTIQPPGVKFDPPAVLQVPNSEGFAPGEKVTMFSYNHQLDAFVTIGTGSVSNDGTIITSDPGSGVIEGGWHGGTNPNPPGAASNITAQLDLVKTAALAARAIAGGTPGPDTTWQICTSGDITLNGPSTCEDTNLCTTGVSPAAGKSFAVGKVKAVHRSKTTGKSAQDTKTIAFCDAPPTKEKYAIAYTPPWAEEYLQRAAKPFESLGCEVTPSFNFGAEYETYDTCCTACPGVAARAGSVSLTGNAGMEIVCAIPGASLPPVKIPGATIQAGLYGGGSLTLAAKGTIGYDACYSPIKLTPSVSAEVDLTALLQLRAVVEVATIEIANIVGEVSTGLKGSFQAGKDDTCNPQIKLIGQLCWTGILLKLKVDLIGLNNTTFPREYERVLVEPRELLRGERCIDGPPVPQGVGASPPACPEAPPPLPDPPCGDPSPPGDGQSGSDGPPGSSAYAGACQGGSPQPGSACRSASDCDDGNVCNGLETCTDGKCKAGGELVCAEDPGFECVTKRCDPIQGCVYTPHDDRCDDGVYCTRDRCVKGQGCVETTDDALCVDAHACTLDYCDAVADCQHDPVDAFCVDGQACTDEHCNAAAGCEYEAHDEQCDDAVSCTEDRCKAFEGCGHTPQDAQCDDTIACTNDRCDPTQGCRHDPDDAQCDDGVACTTDACDPTQGCKAEPDDARCDDGVACTVDDCTTTGCTATADASRCDDGLACTTNACDLVLDCQYTPDDGQCDDGRACTIDACLPGTGCTHTEESCDDGDPCTTDTCAATCVHTPVAGCGGNGGGSGCADSGDCPGQGQPFCDGTQVTVSQCVLGRCDTHVVPCGSVPRFCRNDVAYQVTCGGGSCSEAVVDDCAFRGDVCVNGQCEDGP